MEKALNAPDIAGSPTFFFCLPQTFEQGLREGPEEFIPQLPIHDQDLVQIVLGDGVGRAREIVD